jgi:sortase A
MSGMTNRWRTVLRIIERSLLALGLVLLGFYMLAEIHGVLTLQAALRSFEESKADAGTDTAGALPKMSSLRTDYSLWSRQRVKAYKSSLRRISALPLAMLRIQRLGLEAPVFDSMNDLTLNAGLGRIPGTMRPGQHGNVGIAGHRDGFFRCLKDIAEGDVIELVTPNQTKSFVVDKVTITSPDDVGILRTAKPGLTLVTCYPFYYAGLAPQRYIVHASLKEGNS